MDLSKAMTDLRNGLVKHSPEILTGIGLAGMIATTVLAVKATPKAIQLLEVHAKEEGRDNFKFVEKVKICGKCYIPPLISGVASAACIIGASSVNLRRNAALAAAYTLSDTAMREYRDKVVETIGEKKEQIVQDKLAEDRVKKDPVTKQEVIITDKGNTLCFDSISGRYFKSDIDAIKKAQNEFNRRLLHEMYASLNEFYDEIGLNPTTLGDQLGWNIDDGLIDIYFSSQIADDGTPCIVLNYENDPPRYGYEKLV